MVVELLDCPIIVIACVKVKKGLVGRRDSFELSKWGVEYMWTIGISRLAYIVYILDSTTLRYTGETENNNNNNK